MGILKKALEYYFTHILYLFYPRLCLACLYEAPPWGQLICTECNLKISTTEQHLEKENDFTKKFWGRVKLESGAAMYVFKKGGRAQNLVHNLKYKGKKIVGVLLGKLYGKKLKQSPLFKDVQVIVPVPLHRKKLRKRGFNQSAIFGAGLAESMEIPMLENGLKRNTHSESQTRKTRAERLENVLKVFEVNQPKKLKGKHVLIVDDVLTTGATLEACAIRVLELEGTKVSLATIAIGIY